MSEFGRFEQSDELVNIRGEHIARTFGLDLDLALSGRFSVRITVRVQKLDRVSTIRFVIVVLTVLVTYDRSRARGDVPLRGGVFGVQKTPSHKP